MVLIVLPSFYYEMLGIQVLEPDQLADSQMVSLILWFLLKCANVLMKVSII